MPAPTLERATAALRDLIARGRYGPGDRLPTERELSDGLGMSRSTVREAVRRLVESGVLESRRGSGTYIAAIDLEAVFSVRLRLEPWAARLAAEWRTAAQSRALGARLEELARSVDDPVAFARHDQAIHRTVVEATGNPVLVDLFENLSELTSISRVITGAERGVREAAAQDLTAMVRAIEDRRPDAAESAMTAHLERVRESARREAELRDRRLHVPLVTPSS